MRVKDFHLSWLGISLSWVLGVIVHFGGPDFLLRERLAPALPSVTLPIGTPSDVVSLVPYLFRALTVAFLACALVEFAKFDIGKRLRHGRLYFLALAYQAVLTLDLLRWYSYDWFLYALHFARLINLNNDGSAIRRWVILGAPWPSFLLMVVLLVSIIRARPRVGFATEVGAQPSSG